MASRPMPVWGGLVAPHERTNVAYATLSRRSRSPHQTAWFDPLRALWQTRTYDRGWPGAACPLWSQRQAKAAIAIVRPSDRCRQRCGAAGTDRGCLELPVPGPDQPRAVAETGEPGQTDPRHRMEGTGTAVSAVSQAWTRRKAADSGHRRDRAGAGWLRLGDRKTGAACLRVMR
jgi:hypothetical protein